MFFSVLGVFLITAILWATICVVGRIALGP